MKTINQMSEFEITRWSLLLEAIDLIEQKCKQKKLNFDNVDIKPIPIQKYIDSQCIKPKSVKQKSNMKTHIVKELMQYATSTNSDRVYSEK